MSFLLFDLDQMGKYSCGIERYRLSSTLKILPSMFNLLQWKINEFFLSTVKSSLPLLADPAKARHCSKNTVAIHLFFKQVRTIIRQAQTGRQNYNKTSTSIMFPGISYDLYIPIFVAYIFIHSLLHINQGRWTRWSQRLVPLTSVSLIY